MKPDSHESAELCPRCKKRLASRMYNSRNGHISTMVCAVCLDCLEIEDGFEWGLVDTLPLMQQDRHNEFLAWLDAFEKANEHRDHERWLVRAVARHRQLTLWRAERYDEALLACDIVEHLGFEDLWARWAAGSARARVLEDLGRPDEALAVFEEAFRHQDPEHHAGVRDFLPILVRLSANAGKPVDESWRDLTERVAHEYAVECTEHDTLAESILALVDSIANMKSRRE